MANASVGRAEYLLGSLENGVAARLKKLTDERFAERLDRRDAALWKSDAAAQKSISNRLGWLTVQDQMREQVPALQAFAEAVRADGYAHAVVLGMGGSSLAPACFAKTFGGHTGGMALSVLDLTAPASVRSVEARLDLPRTLFLVSSKSGSTLESHSFYMYFRERLQHAGIKDGAELGRHFAAITDAGSSLATLGKEHRFREVFLNPSDIGGRYSALSLFGLVPAALAGVDIATLLQSGSDMAGASKVADAAENPGLRLGAALGEAALAGHDKVTLIANEKIALFGAWAEQLIAESTGKEGKGIVPVDGEPLAGDVYGDDRLFVGLLLGDADPLEPKLRALAGPTRPVVLLKLGDPLALGGEFFRWELAVATAGAILGLNPFDEPNVTESKENTARILKMPAPGAGPTFIGPVRAQGPEGQVQSMPVELKALLQQVRRGDYIALQAYLPEEPNIVSGLQALRQKLRAKTKVATTLGFGPRFLHSTGQLHKGGPNTGVFIQITGSPEVVGGELPIPGAGFGFGRLLSAQAEGDRQSLRSKGRRLVHLELSDARSGLAEIASAVS